MSNEATFAKSAVSTPEGRRWWLFTACVLVSLTNEVSTGVTNLSLGPKRRDLDASSAVMQIAVTLGKLMLGAFMLARYYQSLEPSGLSRQDIAAATEALRQSIQKGAGSGGLAIPEMVRTQLTDAYRHAFSVGAGRVFACSALICLLCAVFVWFGLKKNESNGFIVLLITQSFSRPRPVPLSK
jgi:hypothetical protein